MGKLTHAVSGSIASFRSADKAHIESLKFHFLPKQAAGTPSPENPIPIEGWTGLNGYRCKKNKAKFCQELLDEDRTQNGITFHALSDSSVHIEGTATATAYLTRGLFQNDPYLRLLKAGTYTLSSNLPTKVNGVNNGCTLYMYGWDVDGNSVGTFAMLNNGTTKKTFTLAKDTYTSIQMGITKDNVFDDDVWVQLSVGQNELDYEDNFEELIPLTFPACSKNLFNPACDMWNKPDVYSISNGQITQLKSDGRGWIDAGFIPIFLPKGTYTLSCSDGNTINLHTSLDGYTANTKFTNGTGTFTLEKDAYVRFKHSASSYPTPAFTVQIELGNTASAYTPYVSDNTFYGGYIDPAAGEIVAEYAIATAMKSDFGAKMSPSTGGIEYRNTLKNYPPTASGVTWNTARQQQKFNLGSVANPYSEGSYGDYIGVMYSMSNFDMHAMRISEYVYQAMSDEDVAVISYKLETPIHIPIPAEDLQAFLDYNNFWSDANDITEVEYAFADRLSERKLIMDTPHLETASAAVASFSTDMKAPVKGLKAYFTPVQEGSGDASPENIRPITGITRMNIEQTGKNLIDISALTGDDKVWWKGSVVSGYPNHCVTPKIPVKPGVAYRLNRNSASQGYVCYFDKNGDYVDQQTWDDYNPSRTIPDGVYYVGITIGTAYLDNPAPQLELGSSASDYAEYVDGAVIPIEFPATKNLFRCIESEMIVSGWNRYIPNPIKSAGTYTLSSVGELGGTGTKGAAFAFVDSSYQRIGSAIAGYNFGSSKFVQTFTVTDEQASAPYLAIMCNSGGLEYSDIVNSIQIETGSTSTEFEPYGTIYGGYIDLVRGKIINTYKKVRLDSFASSWYEESSPSGFFVLQYKIVFADRDKFVCNAYKPVSLPYWNSMPDLSIMGHPTMDNLLRIKDTSYAGDTAGFVANLTNIGAELAYPVLTPIEYDITPQILKTLKGTNNIWADTNGNVEVKYWTH